MLYSAACADTSRPPIALPPPAAAVNAFRAAPPASADEKKLVSIRCQAYRRLVECRARNTAEQPVMFAAIEDESAPLLAAGDSISFMTTGGSVYAVELHLPYVDNFPVLRIWARWGRDPTDGVRKVLFSATPIEAERQP